MALVLASLLAPVAWCPPARAAIPDDLQLDRAPAVLVRARTTPNPHAALACTSCHIRKEESYEAARRFGIHLPLITEGEGAIVLCELCHTDYHTFHPVNFPVRRLLETVIGAGVFPLEMPVEGYTKITCTTCHDVHFPHTAQNLLRGFPVDDRVGGAPFRTRLDFCSACHGQEEILSYSGHRGAAAETGCGSCHGQRDIAGAIGPLKHGLNKSCTLCHPVVRGLPAHFYEYNPFPGLSAEAVKGYGVDLVQGRYVCATCHRHHRPTPEAPFLKDGFVAAAAKSIQFNPHRTTRFCLNCHPLNPPPPGTPDAIAPLVEQDTTRLCRGCHAKEGALQMRHPLGKPGEGAAVPAAWPLSKDGSLGCMTCHLAGHAPQDPENPRFLRGGPYGARNEICFRCHREEPLRGRNIHAEFGEKRGCDFCHEMTERSALLPEGKAGPLLAEPTLLCLPCHGVPPHPASALHTVRPRPTEFLMIDEKRVILDRGKITCHTCHDSHGTEAGGNFLRTAGNVPICTTCHPF